MNETNLATASRLYGYDGQVYWKLGVNSVRTYLAGQADRPPVRTASVLSVIPKGESRPALTSIVALAAESWRVAQLGFSLPLAEPPVAVGPDLLRLTGLGGGSQTARFTGPREHPDTLEYLSSGDGLGGYRVSLDFKTDTLVIDRLSARGTKATSTIRYRVLGSHVPASVGESAFSWQTYQPTEGELIRE